MAVAPVAIIGGGLAGLHVARLLQSEGVGFRILEARDRLGGRILSADAGRVAADGFDLGPSWFWPELHPAMAAVVAGYRADAAAAAGHAVAELTSRVREVNTRMAR